MKSSIFGAKALQHALAAGMGFFLLLGATDAAVQHTDIPTSTNAPQETAEPPLRVPSTTLCSETVLVHTFANSYYAPGYGQHTASTCPGPWSFIGLTVDVSTSGVQFDRLFDIYVGHVPLLSSSTSEPASEIPNAVTYWEVNSDVSRFAGLLATDQPITAILNNVMDSTYTGEYAVTLTLNFYSTGPDNPAIVPPNYVGAVFDPGVSPYEDGPGDYGTSGYAGLGPDTTSNPNASSYSKSLTLPTNLVSLVADVYAEGHGACEEFWWAEPGQCGVGTPVRQAVLSIDGVIAGFAPVYPTIFTGGGGPANWEPIPSPRAWHLDPYQMDLSPFVGLLVDGQPHTFNINIPDAAYSDPGDYWVVGATLLGVTDPVLSQTSGALTSSPVAASATETDSTDPTGTATLDFTATRTGSWTGYVVGSAGTTTTVVSNTFTMSSTSAEEVFSTWNWNYSSQVTVGSAAPVTSTYAKTYTLDGSAIGGGTFGDSGTYSIDGPNPYNSSFSLQLVTVAAVEANVTEAETYNGSDSTGYCYQRIINASAGFILSDQTSPICVTVPGVTTGGTSGGTTSGTTSGGTTSGGATGGTTTGGTTSGTTSGGSTSGGSSGGTTSGGTTSGGTSGGITSGGTASGGTTGGSATLYAPSAALSVTPASGTVPLTVTFNGSASTTPNAGATITSYTFNFGDGTAAVTQSSATLSHTYTSVGNFAATLTVTDSAGESSTNTAQQQVQVQATTSPAESPPLAALSASPGSGTVPLAVGFDASASSTSNSGASISRYVFNFGDGSASVSQSSAHVSHSYTTAGSYTATVQVTDSDGQTSTNSATAAISASAPATMTATAPDAALSVSPASGPAPLMVTFDGSASVATTHGASITRYAFTFGDGSTATQTAPTVNHSYATAGGYTATLTVTDSNGLSSSNAAQQTIQVSSPSPATSLIPPNPALSASPSGGAIPLTVHFDASASSTSNSGATISSYRFVFGDGSAALSQSTPTASHVYTIAGAYTATVSVTDSTGAASSSPAQVLISAGTRAPLAPSAALSASPNAGAAPMTVTFYGAASTTPNSGASIASYTFGFGDGSAAVTQSGSTVSHVYANTGDYVATLTVTDTDGQASNNPAQQVIAVGTGSTGQSTGGQGGGSIGLESLWGLAFAGLLRRGMRRRKRRQGSVAS